MERIRKALVSCATAQSRLSLDKKNMRAGGNDAYPEKSCLYLCPTASDYTLRLFFFTFRACIYCTRIRLTVGPQIPPAGASGRVPAPGRRAALLSVDRVGHSNQSFRDSSIKTARQTTEGSCILRVMTRDARHRGDAGETRFLIAIH